MIVLANEIQELHDYMSQTPTPSLFDTDALSEQDNWTVASMIAEIALNPIATLSVAGLSLLDNDSDKGNEYLKKFS
jgi:hypothetical protein